MYTANFKRFNSVSEKDDKEYVKKFTKKKKKDMLKHVQNVGIDDTHL